MYCFMASTHSPGTSPSGPPPERSRGLAPGTLLQSRYRVSSLLMRDETATVYVVEDTAVNDRLAVLKLFDRRVPSLLTGEGAWRRELQALSRLSHPAIVTILDAGRIEDGTPFLVANYVSGQVLRERLRFGPLKPPVVASIVRQTAEALAAAHASSLWHLELNPDTLVLSEQAGGMPRVTVTDFGISRFREPAGSRGALAPEQRAGQPSAASDTYALAALAATLLTGAEGGHPPDALRLRQLGVPRPARVARLIEQGMAHEEASRPAIGAFARELDRLLSLRERAGWIAAACALGIGLGLIGWLFPNTPARLGTPVSLTNDAGTENHPSFSPDGQTLFFSRGDREEGNLDIFALDLRTRAVRQITQHPDRDDQPECSPDGRTLAFLRRTRDDAAAVVLVPVAGGAERVAAIGRYQTVAWGPDSRWLLLPQRPATEQKLRLFRLDVETGKSKPFFPPDALPGEGDLDPSLSPDGRTLAFVRILASGARELFLVPVDRNLRPAGAAHQRTWLGARIESPQWTADSREVVFAGGPMGYLRLLRVKAAGSSAPVAIAEAGDRVRHPALAARAGRLAYMTDLTDSNIWELRLDRPEGPVSGKKAFANSTAVDEEPRFSPDGRQVAYFRIQGEYPQVWLAREDGSQRQQLTPIEPRPYVELFWHPGGTALFAATSRTAAGSTLRPVPLPGAAEAPGNDLLLPDPPHGMSRDGKFLYTRVTRRQPEGVWRYEASSGAYQPVPGVRGSFSKQTPGGQQLLVSAKQPREGIWTLGHDGATPKLLVEARLARRNAFAPSDAGVHFITHDLELRYYRFDDRQQFAITRLERPYGWGIDVTPDGRRLLITLTDAEGYDLRMFEGFR